jgi:hypothetical protein
VLVVSFVVLSEDSAPAGEAFPLLRGLHLFRPARHRDSEPKTGGVSPIFDQTEFVGCPCERSGSGITWLKISKVRSGAIPCIAWEDRAIRRLDTVSQPDTTVTLPQLCYDVAYFVLPHYAFKDLEKLAHLCLATPTAAGPFFYAMAAMGRKIEPDTNDAQRFHWNHGRLTRDYEYFLLEYPVPPAVDMSDTSLEQMISDGIKFVLAPHFSVILRGVDKVHYFILGQAPMGGGTTLRCILPDGANCNLGPGPEPQVTAFLDVVRERVLQGSGA